MSCEPSRAVLVVSMAVMSCVAVVGAQQAPPPEPGAGPGEIPALASTIAVPGLQEYRIGPEDVLDVLVWKNPDLTRTVIVRPDGRISLPLLNDLQAADLTPMQLRDMLAAGFGKYVNDVEVSVVVREIKSFKVSVVGMVHNPGRYEFGSQSTVLEALALAGGLTDFAKRDRIVVLRHDGRRWQRFGFDYNETILYNAEQNFPLRAGDIVVVP